MSTQLLYLSTLLAFQVCGGFYTFFANSFTICKALLENKGVFPPDTRQVLQEKNSI
jgi:hypothetical protein